MRKGKRMLAACLLIVGCSNEGGTPTADDSAFDLPADQVLIMASQTLTANGVRRTQIEADTTFVFEEGRRFEFRRAKVDFYQDNGQKAGNLTSLGADYDAAGQVFVARGDVVLVSTGPNGAERRLETEELHYDIPNDRIWSDVPSKLTEGGQTTNVTMFRSDSQFRTWEASGVQTQGTAEGGIRF